jgi:hypothetical protein
MLVGRRGGGAAVYVELAFFGFAAGQASVRCAFASTMYLWLRIDGNRYASARGEMWINISSSTRPSRAGLPAQRSSARLSFAEW